jgi:hypothetical protein
MRSVLEFQYNGDCVSEPHYYGECVLEFQYDGEGASELCIIGSVSVNSKQFRVPSVIICTEISSSNPQISSCYKIFKIIR